MASPILASLQAQVAQSISVETSAQVLIEGFVVRVQSAVDAALANGATAAELAPVQAEVDAMAASAAALSAAVVANTPAA